MTEPVRPTPAQLRALAKRDPVLGAAMRSVDRYPGFPVGPQRSNFHYLVRAICYQQLASAAARTIYGRVKALTPGAGFPTPVQVLAMPKRKLEGAGLSGSKARAVLDLADKVESGALKLRGLGRLPDEIVIEQLTSVWGIGVWSAQMFLMFKLGRLDVMPTTDLGIQNGVMRLDGMRRRPTPKQVEARSEPWGPLCSVASWVLWRVADAEEP